MVLREVSAADVEAALAAPFRTATVRPHATSYHGHAVDGRAIVVSVAHEPSDLVITVMLDESGDLE